MCVTKQQRFDGSSTELFPRKTLHEVDIFAESQAREATCFLEIFSEVCVRRLHTRLGDLTREVFLYGRDELITFDGLRQIAVTAGRSRARLIFAAGVRR